LHEHCLADLNKWEQNFISDMYERVTDGEDQELPLDEYFIIGNMPRKVDEIWDQMGL